MPTPEHPCRLGLGDVRLPTPHRRPCEPHLWRIGGRRPVYTLLLRARLVRDRARSLARRLTGRLARLAIGLLFLPVGYDHRSDVRKNVFGKYFLIHVNSPLNPLAIRA